MGFPTREPLAAWKGSSESADGAIVTATVADQIKGEKLTIFKKRRRKNYRRTRGHRQLLTVLKVTEILPDGRA